MTPSPVHSGSNDPLLATKLCIPPARPNLIPRRRLIERLNDGIARKLVLISAPAGFGKTTLLSSWRASLSDRGPAVAWVSLDEGDNDPLRFWGYFIGALEGVWPRAGEDALALLRLPQPPPIESVLTVLINSVTPAPGSLAVVLDDYSTVRSQAIHNAVAFLIDHLPQQMHLVIVTRTDPPLPLSRLRVRDQMTEIRAADLRFNRSEAAVFLNQVMGLNFSIDDVAAVEARTEGWIAGLQLAALSMKGREDVSNLIAAFSGSHRYIVDYLGDEILHRQPESVRHFLQQTSILDRLAAPLCDAVTGRTDSQATLEQLEEANLFIVPLDDNRCWYRYHQLFVDFLRDCLHRDQPELPPQLHRKAAEWFECTGLEEEAVNHVLAARDFGWAARLIERTAWPMLSRGGPSILLRWLEALPEELVRARPQLCIYHAWALIHTGKLDDGALRLEDAERGLDAVDLRNASGTAEIQRMAGEVAAARAYGTRLRGDVARSIELCQQAREKLPQDNLTLRSTVALNLGLCYWMSGNLAAASAAYEDAFDLSQAAGNVHLALAALSRLGKMQELQGQLRQAADTYQEVLRLAREHGGSLPATGLAYVGLAGVHHKWNDPEVATDYAIEGIRLGKQGGHLESLLDGYLTLARVMQAQGNTNEAVNSLKKAEQLVRRHNLARGVTMVAAHGARLWLMQGHPVKAVHWVQESGITVDDELSYLREFEYITLARVLIYQSKLDQAIILLKRLQQAAEEAGRRGHVVETLMLRALATEAQGNSAQALGILAQALYLAEPGGYVRVFVDEGAALVALMSRMRVGQGKLSQMGLRPSPEYVMKVLSALEGAAKGTTRPEDGRLSRLGEPLVEPLSDRELEVLRLIAVGMSNHGIAAVLVLAESTVKRHISNIYGKLNVQSRTQAVALARQVGLLH